MLASMSVSAVAVEGDNQNPLSTGRPTPSSSGRPWTTGGGGGVGGGRHAPPVDGGTSLKAPASGVLASTPLKAKEVGKEVAGAGGGEGEGGPGGQRPQTAAELSRRRHCCSPEQAPKNSTGSSWQPVWESLKTARLVSPTVSKEAGEESSTQAGGACDDFVRLRNVDFRCQRRARTARTRTRTTGGRGGCPGKCDGSLSAEEPGGSDESDEADYRNEVKKRASLFETASTTACDVTNRAPGGSSTLPLYPPLTPEAPAGLGGGEQLSKVSAQQQKASCAEREKMTLKKVRRRKETAATNMPPSSRRSLAAMDCSSSSEDEPCVRRPKPPPRKTLQVSDDRCGVDNYSYGGVDAVGASSGGASSGGDRSESPIRRVSSVHASRVLGFDLKKSLAAIDEWTDKATAASRDDSCSGAAVVARLGATTTTSNSSSPPVPCFVQYPERPTPSASKTRGGREVALNFFRHNATSDATNIGSVAPKTIAQKIVALGACNVDSSTDEEDGSEEEGIISVAAARAALGISKGCTAPVLADSPDSRTPGPSRASAAASRDFARRPSPGEIDKLLGERETMPGGKSVGSSSAKSKRKESKRVPSAPASPGVAVGMSDEALRCMLRRQPRTVPELRTKESFREFFQGMGEERMGRLLRGAYEGSLPADEVDRKVDKRLGLVGDLLAR